jgi:hypothetical protein
VARAARDLVKVAALLFGLAALGCGAKAPPRPPTEATTTHVRPPEKAPAVAPGMGGAATPGGTGGSGGSTGATGATGTGGIGGP